jgi:hypothetical protein
MSSGIADRLRRARRLCDKLGLPVTHTRITTIESALLDERDATETRLRVCSGGNRTSYDDECSVTGCRCHRRRTREPRG